MLHKTSIKTCNQSAEADNMFVTLELIKTKHTNFDIQGAYLFLVSLNNLTACG